jgi:hypothetical protein
MTLGHLRIILLFTALLVSLVGCNQKKSSSPGTSTQCLVNPYTGICDNSYYGAAPGFTPYPGTPGYASDPYSHYRYQLDQYYNSQFGGLSHLCACPPGSRPVYNGSLGIGCAAQQMIPQTQSVYFHGLLQYHGSAYNGHYVNIPQISNVHNNSATGCYSNVAWSCVVGQVNQCPAGTTCKSAGNNNSPIGICSQ